MIRVVLGNKRCKTPPTFISIDLTTQREHLLDSTRASKYVFPLAILEIFSCFQGSTGTLIAQLHKQAVEITKRSLLQRKIRACSFGRSKTHFTKHRDRISLSTANGTAFLWIPHRFDPLWNGACTLKIHFRAQSLKP